MPKTTYPETNYFEYKDSPNVYYQKLKAISCSSDWPVVFVDKDTEKFLGNWQKKFGYQKIILDIGSYLGDTVIDLATRNPDSLIIGMEWKNKYAHRSVEKILNQKLKNAVILRANIARITKVFAPGELHRVQVFFPDPWPKRSQNKWRAIHQDFFQCLAYLLEKDHHVFVKTDHPEYADFIKKSFLRTNAFDWLVSRDTSCLKSLLLPTAFEKIFMRKKQMYYSYFLRRNTSRVNIPESIFYHLHTN